MSTEADVVVVSVPLDQVEPSPTNPRKYFDPKRIEELAASIQEHGVQQPVLLRPKADSLFQLVCGESRWRASKLAGRETIPAIVREMDDRKVLELQLAENTARSDLTPLEEADALAILVKAHGATAEEAAARVGRSPGFVHGRLALGRLGKKGRKLLEEGSISLGQALRLARLSITGIAEVEEYLATVSKPGEQWHFDRAIETALRDLSHAPFDTASATLVPDAGACSKCPKRSSAQAALALAGVPAERQDSCTDSGCWATKVRAGAEALRTLTKARGGEVIQGKEAESFQSERRGLVSVTRTVYEEPKRRKWADILKKEIDAGTVKTTLVIGKDGAELLINEKDARKVAKERGLAWAQSAKSSPGAQEKERTARRAALKRVGAVAVERIAREAKPSAGLWRALFKIQCPWGIQPPLAKALGLEPKEVNAYLTNPLREERIERMEALFAMAFAASEPTHDGKWTDRFADLARVAGVDLTALEEDMQQREKEAAAAKASKEKKPEPAKGKAPKAKRGAAR